MKAPYLVRYLSVVGFAKWWCWGVFLANPVCWVCPGKWVVEGLFGLAAPDLDGGEP